MSFDPSLAVPVLTSTAILGASPRALAVSPDGTKVYLAVFESGNKTTVIPRTIVNSAAGPYAGVNPPPNSGTLFDPPRTVGQPNPPRVAHIVSRHDSRAGESGTRVSLRHQSNVRTGTHFVRDVSHRWTQ